MQEPYKFAIITTCPEYWGGSEELWYGAAINLLESGHQVKVFKTNVDQNHQKIQSLNKFNAKTYDLNTFRLALPVRVVSRFFPYPYNYTFQKVRESILFKHLKFYQPDLVIVSQGENFDGIWFAESVRKKGFPYVLISQKAVDFQWLLDYQRETGRNAHQGAIKTYFVSNHNFKLTEQQIGVRLPNAEVVHNPFMTKIEEPLAFPNSDELKLACVGRLWLLDKGQDVLIRILSKEKWKSRNLSVTFYGEGLHKQALQEQAKLLGVNNIKFAGHTKDINSIWENNHALILPSRSEGLPLALVEAMMCGRIGIMTDVGGVAEVITDGETGFIADSATDKAFEAAMEKAWEKRDRLELMGKKAAQSIRKIFPADPAKVFALKLTDLVKKI